MITGGRATERPAERIGPEHGGCDDAGTLHSGAVEATGRGAVLAEDRREQSAGQHGLLLRKGAIQLTQVPLQVPLYVGFSLRSVPYM